MNSPPDARPPSRPEIIRTRPLLVRVKRPSERRSLSRSASRALDVLECFGERREPLRAVEISHLLQTRPSTTYQLLKTMVDSGHLVFDDRAKTYFPSPRLAAFARWTSELYGAEASVHELVQEVNERTGMVATLATPNGLFMQVLDLAVAPGLLAERGMSISLFGSALGSAYLATLPEDEIAALADRARVAPARLPEVLADLAETRRRGHSSIAADAGRWSLAMPLPARHAGVPLILGLAGPEDEVRQREAEIVAIMRAAIARWLSPT